MFVAERMAPKKRLEFYPFHTDDFPDVFTINDNFGDGDEFLKEVGILHEFLVRLLGFDVRNFSTVCDVRRTAVIPPVARLKAYAQKIQRDNKTVQARNAEIAPTLEATSQGSLDQTPVPLMVGEKIRVVYFNAERGREWQKECSILQYHPKLMGASIIFLNEMDSGMARSGNQVCTPPHYLPLLGAPDNCPTVASYALSYLRMPSTPLLFCALLSLPLPVLPLPSSAGHDACDSPVLTDALCLWRRVCGAHAGAEEREAVLREPE
jgi:hypothetical protein